MRRGFALLVAVLALAVAAPAGAAAPDGRCPEPGSGRLVHCRHVVRRGEWLWSIARQNLRDDFGMRRPPGRDIRTRAAEIRALNREAIGPDPARLRAGTELRLYPWVGGGQVAAPAGVATNGRPGRYADAQAVDLDAEGRAVTAGMLGGSFALARFTADGRADPSFGDGGLVTTAIGSFAWARDVAVQRDGRILAAGQAGRVAGELAADVAVTRYLPSGALDRTWGGDGTVTIPFGTEYASGQALALEPDGGVVVAGGVGEDALVLRLRPDGTLDPAFGAGGSVRLDLAGGIDVARDVLRRPDGRLVVVGTAAPAPQSGEIDAFVAGLLPTGRPDAATERRLVDYGTPFDAAAAVALAPDGSLLVSGSRVEERITPQVVLARHAADGTLLGTTVTSAGSWSDGDDVAVTPGGTVVVVGQGGTDAVLLRYDLGGRLLELRSLDFGGERNAAFGVRIAPDGRAVVGGCTCDGANTAQRGGFEIPSSIVVARYPS